MIGIDTNVLIRYLIQDDKVQSQKATNLIDKHVGQGNSIFINNIVICETIWVLERGYKYHKKEVIKVLKEILATLEFYFEDHKTLWLVVNEYEKSKADFSDILIGKLNELNNCKSTFTFDEKATSLSWFSVID